MSAPRGLQNGHLVIGGEGLLNNDPGAGRNRGRRRVRNERNLHSSIVAHPNLSFRLSRETAERLLFEKPVTGSIPLAWVLSYPGVT